MGQLGARNWLRLTGVKVKVTGREHLDPNQPYVFVANHQSYLDASPLFAFTGRRVGALAKKELLKAPILGYGMGFVNVIAIDRSNRERAVETLTGSQGPPGLRCFVCGVRGRDSRKARRDVAV